MTAAGTRERIEAATARLLRRQGYHGTGLKQISAEASAPFGSIYHFFPGGKGALAEEVIRTEGARYADLFDIFLGEASDLPAGIAAAFEGAAQALRDSGYQDACPVATVALEVASVHEGLRQATADVFDGWIERGVGHFKRWDLDDQTARSLVMMVIMALEGAFLLARARRSTEPLAVAGAVMAQLMGAAIASRSTQGQARP